MNRFVLLAIVLVVGFGAGYLVANQVAAKKLEKTNTDTTKADETAA